MPGIFKQLFGRLNSAITLQPVKPPKVKPNLQGFPSYLKTTRTSSAFLPINDRRLSSTDILGVRNQADTPHVLRELIASTPDLSAAVFAYLRIAITDGYSAVAKNTDGTFNPEATALLQSLLVRFDVLPDYSVGYTGSGSMRSYSESLGKELLTYGAMSAELVMGKDRLPARIQPLSVMNIKFVADADRLKPVQYIAGQQIDLDIPTFFYTALDQDLLEPYSNSPFESAIQPVLFSQSFMNDIQRIVKRAIHPRLEITVDEDKFRKNLPAEVQHDETKLADYRTSFITELQGKINGLNPEDALVYFDTLGIGYLNNGNTSLSTEYDVLSSMADAKLATGAKTLPAILGHGAGSSNIASTETMLFMKNAAGAVQSKLNEFYSKILTLAVRVFGFDVYVEFKYNTIDLRPDSELEAFRAQKQSRVLELLSLGLLTDEEASLQLTGRLPPVGYTPLSGTMFKSALAPTANPDQSSNSGSTLNQKVKSNAPTGVRGGNKKANPQKTTAEGGVVVDIGTRGG